jgi:hypothetical protein
MLCQLTHYSEPDEVLAATQYGSQLRFEEWAEAEAHRIAHKGRRAMVRPNHGSRIAVFVEIEGGATCNGSALLTAAK